MATEAHVDKIVSSPSNDSPTIVLVQGSFQTPLVYEAFVDSLKALGHPTFQPSLPSCSNMDDPKFPNITPVDDALAIRLELIRQVE